VRENRHSCAFASRRIIDTAFFLGQAGYGPKFRRDYGFVVMEVGRSGSLKYEPKTSPQPKINNVCD